MSVDFFFPPTELNRLEIILGRQIMNEHLGPNSVANTIQQCPKSRDYWLPIRAQCSYSQEICAAFWPIICVWVDTVRVYVCVHVHLPCAHPYTHTSNIHSEENWFLVVCFINKVCTAAYTHFITISRDSTDSNTQKNLMKATNNHRLYKTWTWSQLYHP